MRVIDWIMAIPSILLDLALRTLRKASVQP